MFDLTFLSNEKQKILQKLEDRLAKASSPQVRNETMLALQEVRSQAKPYLKCDIQEADELKSQLLQKINILINLGKIASAEVFQMHLKDVDFHIQTMHMSEVLKETDRTLSPEDGDHMIVDKMPSLNSIAKEKKRKEAYSHRWLLGFEDEPETTNK